jgi:hypothetical protein
MRKYYLLIALAFSCQISIAQITFSYDNAGNRILRKTPAPLPVTLISFTATKLSGNPEGSTALLNWQTSSETNSDRFDIERSQDGKKWINIGTVRANGDKTSSSYYSFIDRTPADGENLYRLKMIDRAADRKDGTYTFSRMQSVYFNAVISFYPNPVKDWLRITGSANGSIQILNNAGKVVYNSARISSEGIDMSKLSTGIYLVRITHDDGTSVTSRVVKE